MPKQKEEKKKVNTNTSSQKVISSTPHNESESQTAVIICSTAIIHANPHRLRLQ